MRSRISCDLRTTPTCSFGAVAKTSPRLPEPPWAKLLITTFTRSHAFDFAHIGLSAAPTLQQREVGAFLRLYDPVVCNATHQPPTSKNLEGTDKRPLQHPRERERTAAQRTFPQQPKRLHTKSEKDTRQHAPCWLLIVLASQRTGTKAAPKMRRRLLHSGCPTSVGARHDLEISTRQLIPPVAPCRKTAFFARAPCLQRAQKHAQQHNITRYNSYSEKQQCHKHQHQQPQQQHHQQQKVTSTTTKSGNNINDISRLRLWPARVHSRLNG